MLIDFSPVMRQAMTWQQFQQQYSADDLRRFTNGMIDHMLALIADCTDADVMFVPSDPDAHDPYAATETEVGIAWTLGHVIVHVTASAEEAAALAVDLARGVRRDGRSRYEVPWETVTTIAHCRARLEESRRMRLASFDMWPDVPHRDVTVPSTKWGAVDAVGRFLLGLRHDSNHLAQIADIVAQARAEFKPGGD